jgi:hypothetical protein
MKKTILYSLILILGFAFFDAFGQDNQNLFPKRVLALKTLAC